MKRSEQIKYFKNRIKESTDKEELQIIFEFTEDNLNLFSMKDIETLCTKLFC